MNRAANKLSWLINPALLLRESGIYARIIADVIDHEQLCGDVSLVLEGGGRVPQRISRKVGEPRITIVNVAELKLTPVTLRRVIDFAACPQSGEELTVDGLRAYCQPGAVIVEALAGSQRGRVRRDSASRRRLAARYREGHNRLLDLHRQGAPAAISDSAPPLSDLRRALVEECVREAVQIAMDEMEDELAMHTRRLAVILAAGSVRGPSLFSDVDILLVSDEQGSASGHYDAVSERIVEILDQCGMDVDNLSARFGDRSMVHLPVRDCELGLPGLRDVRAFLHAITDSTLVCGEADIHSRFVQSVEKMAFAPGALSAGKWRPFYLRQYLRKKTPDNERLPPPSVWLRDVTIIHLLARTHMRTISGDCSVPRSLQHLLAARLLSEPQAGAVTAAYEFFMWLRNEAGLFHGGGESLIRARDLGRFAGSHPRIRSADGLLDACNTHSRTVEDALCVLRRRLGHGAMSLALIGCEASLLGKWLPVAGFALRGDASVRLEAGRETRQPASKEVVAQP